MAAVDITFPGNLAQVDTADDLRGIPTSLIPKGTLYLVTELEGLYGFEPSSLVADNGTTVIKPADRTSLQAGRWLKRSGGLAQGAKGDKGDQGSSGPSDTHSETALAAMPRLTNAIRNRQFTTTPIKIAGVGSSNMLNADGGLSGPGNSPVEVALRELKAALDPNGTCIWEFANFGVNGSAYSGWDALLNGNPKTPHENVIDYDPDVVVMCYGTNDYSPENFNVGETRGLIAPLVLNIYRDCHDIGADVINMIPPASHVGKSKQTRVNPATGLTVQGRALNFGVPISYPTRSFQRGQSSPSSPGGDLPVTFTDTNKIVAPAGTFDDPSLYAGACLWVTDPGLQPILNGGYMRIASVSSDKSTLVIDNYVSFPTGYDTVVGAPVNFTTSGPVNVTIWRVAIDPFTELTPSFTNAFGFIDVDGTPVAITTREQIVSNDVRLATALSPYSAVLVDTMYDYLRAVVQHGEDRYYPSADNSVHWNDLCVYEVITPAFRALAQSLAVAQSGIATPRPDFVPALVVRPEGSPLVSPADQRIGRKVDIQMMTGESAVVRAPEGHLHTEFLPLGGRIDHLTPGGLPWKKSAIEVVEANVSTVDGLFVQIPDGHYAKGDIFGKNQGVGIQNRRITAWNDGGAIAFQSYDDLSSSSEIYSLNAQDGGFKISVLAANTLISLELKLRPFTYGAFQF